MTVFANLTCIVPHWDVAPNITAFTTTRHGGISEPPYNELNLGLHVGDDAAAVKENRRRLVQSFALPSEPVWLNQTHSTVVTDVAGASGTASKEETHERGEQPASVIDADGAYTCIPNTVLAVLTADCLPVVISDAQGSQIAVVHAGWRGLANGILANAIKCFRPASELHAWLGPAIGPSKFEVGEDVRDAFMALMPDNAAHFSTGNAPGKYWADLYALARCALTSAGCQAISGADYCTHTHSDLFHSYRRDGSASGRIATVAWIS